MNKDLVQQIWNCFKDTHGCEMCDSVDLFQTQRDLLEFLMGIGKDLEQSVFTEIGTGYRGRIFASARAACGSTT